MYSNNNMMIRSIKVESTNEPKMREAKVNRNKLGGAQLSLSG